MHRSVFLFEYHVWANEKWFSHLEQLSATSNSDIFRAPVQSVFPSIAHTAAHMYLFDQLWLAVLMERPTDEIFSMIGVWSQEAKGKSLEDVRQLFSRVVESYRTLLLRTSDPDKATTIEHPHYGRLETRFSDILQHVVNHGTYHRGNITAMLRQLGHAGVATDYVFYLADRQKERSASVPGGAGASASVGEETGDGRGR